MITKEQRDDWQRLNDAATEFAAKVACEGEFFNHVAREFDAAVAAMTAELDAEKARADAELADRLNVEKHRARLLGERDAARTERDAANAARESQWKELQAARADAAAMRQVLTWFDRLGGLGLDKHAEIERVLAPDAGRALLAEVDRLREENVALTTHAQCHCSGHMYWRNQHAATKAALARAHTTLQSSKLEPLSFVAGKMVSREERAEHNAMIDDVLADPTGRAAAEYVTSLEEFARASILQSKFDCSHYEPPCDCGARASALDGRVNAAFIAVVKLLDAEYAEQLAAYAAVEALRKVKP